MPNRRHAATLLLLLCLALGGLAPAMAAELTNAVYTGTLGSQAIALELTPGDGTLVTGRYFYARHRLDLSLDGKQITAGHLALHEGYDDTAPRALLVLDRQADGGWRGTWRSPQGKTLPVLLRPAQPAPPAAGITPGLRRLYASDRYEYLRLASLKLQAGRRETFMGYTLQWWTQPDSKIALFEIVDGYPDAERARINRLLMQRLWREVGSYYACMSTASRFGHGGYDQTVTPRLLTPGLLSISVYTDYDCGGAHPDFGDAPINLDARSSQPLTLEDILWLGKGKPLHYVDCEGQSGDEDTKPVPGAATFDDYSAYREHALAPWLAQQWLRLYPSQAKPAHSDDDCGYDAPGVWQFGSWYLTPTGIFIGPSFPRVARVCEANDDWSVLPWRIVRQHPGRLALPLPE